MREIQFKGTGKILGLALIKTLIIFCKLNFEDHHRLLIKSRNPVAVYGVDIVRQVLSILLVSRSQTAFSVFICGGGKNGKKRSGYARLAFCMVRWEI